MATVSPIVILNKNTVRREKTMGNPAKRILSSTSSNSPTYEDKKNKVFVTPNRFKVLQMEEQDNVSCKQNLSSLHKLPKTLPEPSKKTLPNIVLTNVTDFIMI
ncbi:PRE C2HC domain-containing protein [Aphis craccivora]|uniref:PRE C2HC domain-containing protein n=1 Tax=Aphis craccivora TaxID=307492 RepID=A0A6G0Y381_APHCR|nr:PRE C2HC domain-containing protein [Aphis craccivora]